MFVLISPYLSNAKTKFDEFLNTLNSAPIESKYSLVNDFIDSQTSYPIVENDTIVHFVTRQKARSVFLAGDFTNWEQNIKFTNVPYTDLWYYTDVFEPDAHLDYKFVIDGTTWILDPINPRKVPGGFGDNSELVMPQYRAAPEIEHYDDIAHGTLRDTILFCESMQQSRKVIVYLPYNYSQRERLPLIIFQDGTDYLNFAMAKNILDYLIHNKQIEPVVGIFLPPKKRNDEYAGKLKEVYGEFIAHTLFSYLYKNYHVSDDPEDHAVIGASNGGNISLWLGFHYPELCRKIGAQSPYVEDELQDAFKISDTLPLMLYINIGKYDIPKLKEITAQFIPILSEKDYDFIFEEFPEGHSWGNWRAHLKDILIGFFEK